MLENTFSVDANLTNVPQDRERHMPLIDIRKAEHHLSEIILSPEKMEILDKIIKEYSKSELLSLHGLEPNHKILFCGPPGCGKTLCAEIVAHELRLPLLYVRFDSIVSSYLGETAANLRKVFDFAASGRWVVMFDEFDAIGKARDDQNEHGELKRVVNSFLQMLDSFKSSSLIIAATNHERLLDPALWRRFDEVMYFSCPSLSETKKLIKMKLQNFPYSIDIDNESLKFKRMSYADIERVCFDSIKIAIMDDKDSVSPDIFGLALKRHNVRLKIAKVAKNNKTS